MSPKETEDADRPSREERRLDLLDSAVDGIRTIGSGASMEELAAHGGVTKPILYRHFGNRDGLVQAIGEQYAERLVAELFAGLGAEKGSALLWHTVDAYLRFLEQDPELYVFLMRQTSVRDDSRMVNAVIDTVATQIGVVVAERFEARGRDASGAQPWAFGVIGMVQHAGDWWLKNNTMSRTDLTRHLTQLLWSGFHGIANDLPSRDTPAEAAPLH